MVMFFVPAFPLLLLTILQEDLELILAHHRDDAKELDQLSSINKNKQSGLAVGHWRDGLLDIGTFGLHHGSAWTACCCLPIAIAQVISRLNFTMLGTPHALVQQRNAIFQTIALSVISFWCTRVALFLIIAILDPNKDNDDDIKWTRPGRLYFFICFLDDVIAYLYFAVCIVVLRNVRVHVRRMSAIPKHSSCEDEVCSFLCPCLVAAQLLRHTGDYQRYGSRCCCTETGLPVNAPSIV